MKHESKTEPQTTTPQRAPLVAALDADRAPRLHESAWVAPGAVIVGEVSCGEGCSFWYNSIVRADVGHVRLGDRVNVQDLAMIHMSEGLSHTEIGDDVTIGHTAIVHGAKIGDRVLIGMGSIVLDNAVIGDDSIVGANALVTARTVIPPRSLVLGSPAKVVKTLSEDDIGQLEKNAEHYVHVAQLHRAAVGDAASQEPDAFKSDVDGEQA